MSRADETEVLVVGAGPVGLMTALLLAEQGVEVKIIDKEWRTAAHSYACVLHPRTLRLLDRLGLAADVVAAGRRIGTVAFYEGESRRAEMKLSQLAGDFACAVVLPQSAFEDALEKRLKQKNGIKVHWNHRLTELQAGPDSVMVATDKLAQTAKGYIVAEWDWTVQKKLETRAEFVVGADGHGSMVRSRLGIEYERLAGPELFAVFEFETESDPGDEVRIVLDGPATNVMWPLPGNRCRWSFQLVKPQDQREFPEKEREAWRIVQKAADENTRHLLERLAQKRAPWFKTAVKDVYWSFAVPFEHRLAKQFGKGRCWLVGDAAHQTGPVGVQSMNAGLWEAEDLAKALKQVVRDGARTDLLEEYSRAHRAYWDELLNPKGGPGVKPGTDAWVKEHGAKMLPCLPATGRDLANLAGQAGLEWGGTAAASVPD